MRRATLYFVYNLLICLAIPFVLLVVVIRYGRRVRHGLSQWDERWGRLPDDALKTLAGSRNWWWVHAVSVGEVKAIEPFLETLRRERPAKVLLSLVTPEAIGYAQTKGLADILVAAPIDLPWVVRRVVRHVNPKLFISVESEFWPNILREARRSGARVALINGRMSAHSFASYRRVRSLVQPVLDCFDRMLVRESQDEQRLAALGVPPNRLAVTGNLKYDAITIVPRTSFPDQPTLVFGSTREGEEVLLLPVAEALRARLPSLRVIWAPRHLHRLAELDALLRPAGQPPQRKSAATAGAPLCAGHILWDTMGDLLDAYRAADVAVIGGSFVSKGGQNPIEPAALGVPAVLGPSMENFTAISEALLAGQGAVQTPLSGLEQTLSRLFADEQYRRSMGEKAQQVIESQRGATDRTYTELRELVRG